jgi:hypothetical protein
MSRFGNQAGLSMDVEVRGRTLKLKGKDGMNGIDLLRLTTTMSGALKQAQDLLERVVGQLYDRALSAKVLRYAHRYFKTPIDHISVADLNRMKSVVTCVRTGLTGDLTLKVGQNVGHDETKNPHGAVRFGAPGKAPKTHTNQVFDMGDEVMKRTGAIRLRDDTMQSGRLGVVTLIHEATHKYAGTDDVAYFSDDGLTPANAFTKAGGLINADSYAWFIVKVGRSWSERSLFG